MGKVPYFDNQLVRVPVEIANCYGSMYISTPAETTISEAGGFQKLLGTTTADLSQEFSHANNRLTHIGKHTKIFQVSSSCVIKSDTKDLLIQLKYYKNGTTPIDGSLMCAVLDAVNREYPISLDGVASLGENDFIEIWGTHANGGAKLTLHRMTTIISAIGL